VQQTGEYRIAAAREKVWLALNDPEVLAQCIEGCQSMTKVADDAYTTSIKAKVGPVSATFSADLNLTELNPPSSYTLNGSVKGGAAGFGKGAAHVSLVEDGNATILRYQVDANVGGKLAQVGSRLIDGAARKMADDFFRKFSEVVAPGQVERVAAAPTAATVKQGYERSGQYVIWIIVFAVLALAIALAL
jgi:carbon monoxide dehydrogenase subunit G